MDDMVIIRDNASLREGDIFRMNTQIWTTAFYYIQYRLFGMSEVAFHAVNWILHTASACLLFLLGRELLASDEKKGIALFGALLFAVHPLCSEVPNYARCQDLAWVTVFSLVGCLGITRFLRTGKAIAIFLLLLGVIGATISKGPGFFHAAMATALIALVSMKPQHFKMISHRAVWLGGAALALIAGLWIIGVLPRWFAYAENNWSTPRFIGHAYTVSRVFWEFAWRAIIPIRLSADHQIAETLVKPGEGWFGVDDGVAMFAAGTMLGLAAVAFTLIWKRSTRLFGACLFLFVGTMIFRVMYIVPEFMPEYRIYPGMPWFCLGAAIVLSAFWKALPGGGSPRWIAAVIMVAGAFLSAKRSFLWHDTERLCMDILRQYPAQARAIWKLHDRDMDRGEWQAIIDRQQTMWPPVFNSFIKQMQELQPNRDLNSGHFALADVASHGRLAIAMAHIHGPDAGVAAINQLESRMRQLGILEETNRTIWGYFHHARAIVMEKAKKYPEALESMRFEGVFAHTQNDILRIESKIAESAGKAPAKRPDSER